MLGLLLQQEQPLAPYRLSSLLMQRLPAWQVTHSAVANLLKRLAAEGYVALIEAPTRGYAATELARTAFDEWMQGPLSRQTVREELHARIASSSERHAPLLFKALEDYERECFAMLDEAGDIGGSVATGTWRSLTLHVTRAAADETLQANIRWSRVARRWIKDWLAQSAAQAHARPHPSEDRHREPA